METNGTNGSTALARITPTQQLGAYEPRSMSDAWQMAAHFAKSGFLGEINTPEKAFLIMATGAELGIPGTTALRTISIVKGKPVLSADLMKAMCLSKREICEHFKLVKSDDKIATYSAKRVGDEPVVMSFSMEDAARAKLKDRGADKGEAMYDKYPALMLRHRCVAMVAREVFPEIVLGIFCQEEVDEIRDEVRIVDEQTIETRGVNELEARIETIRAAIVGAQTLEDLAAVRTIVAKDPAAKEIMGRLGGEYEAKKNEIQGAK
jgi:hypothetical protein